MANFSINATTLDAPFTPRLSEDSYDLVESTTLLDLQVQLKQFLDSRGWQIVIVSLIIFDCLLVFLELTLHIFYDDDLEWILVVEVVNYSVLSLFLVELVLQLLANGSNFFHSYLMMFDGAVIVTTFGLAVGIRQAQEGHAVALLIVLRMWRVLWLLMYSSDESPSVSVAPSRVEARKSEQEETSAELKRKSPVWRSYGTD